MTKPEPGEDRYIDLCRHQRAPREGPALFHTAHNVWQGGRQDYVEPCMQPLRAHCARCSGIDWRDVARAVLGCDDNRPKRTHDDYKKHRCLGLSEPEDC